MRVILPMLICIVAVFGIGYGEWLESVPNTLLDGWRQFGGASGTTPEQRFTLLDLIEYAPFYVAVLGVWKSGALERRPVAMLFSAVILGGGIVGLVGMLAYPVLYPYGMRLGVLPLYVLVATLWLWRFRSGGHRIIPPEDLAD